MGVIYAMRRKAKFDERTALFAPESYQSPSSLLFYAIPILLLRVQISNDSETGPFIIGRKALGREPWNIINWHF
jgi:hypothetical protein